MTERVHAIDAIRGFCLINIFVNHITLGALLEFSPSKIAFCDSADIFVFLAGISSFLAYGRRIPECGFAAARDRMWRRAIHIYLVTLALLALSFLIFCVGEAGAPPPNPAITPPGVLQSAGPASFIWNAVTLQQSVGYSMVLRLYVFLMIAAPFYVWLALKRYWYPLVPAGLVWLLSGHFGIASRDSLTGDLLSMTILPWQLVFASGVALGAAIVQRVPLPRSPILTAAAALFVGGGTLLLVLGPELSAGLHHWLEVRNAHFWTGISKSYQSPLRLAYLAALAYLFMAFPKAPLFRLVHASRGSDLLNRLGGRSLEIFAFGALFALAIDQLLWNLMERGLIVQRGAAAVALEIALFSVGLAGMGWIASGRRKAAKPSSANEMVTPARFERTTL